MNAVSVVRVSIPIPGAAQLPERPPVVLIVSGDADWREAATRVLVREGYDVVAAAHSGHAMLACLTAPCVDLLLAELAMDDMAGPALAERVRRLHPRVRPFYVAAPGTPAGENVLVRPFTSDDLVARLATVSAPAS